MKKHSPVSADGNTAAVHVPNRGSESRRFRLVGRTSRIARARWPCAAGGRSRAPAVRSALPSLPAFFPPDSSFAFAHPSAPSLPASALQSPTPCLSPPLPAPFRPTALPPSPLALPLPRFPSPPFSPALAPVSRSRLPSPAPVSRLTLPSPVSRLSPSPPVSRSPKFSGKRRRRGLTHSFFVLCSFVQNVAACDVGFIDSKKEGTCLVPDIAAM